jgi:hypothetical protein
LGSFIPTYEEFSTEIEHSLFDVPVK